jgi:hypothetical protein
MPSLQHNTPLMILNALAVHQSRSHDEFHHCRLDASTTSTLLP